VLISLYRKLITQEFGDFEKSFNIGNIDGGFGQSRGIAPTATNRTPAVPSDSPITPSTHLRKLKRKAFRPASLFDSSFKTQSVADEFLQLSTTRKKLMAQIDIETEEDEKNAFRGVLAQVNKRRKEISNALSTNVATP
jgi:hypothetical protein